MNKEAFLKKLRKRLSVLEDSEIEDIVSEYEGYIAEKVSLGLTEEDAVKELGDFEEIVNDLLSAYKVKGCNKEDNGFNHIINKIGAFIDNFMDSLSDKSGSDILKILIQIVLILFLICLLKIPFVIIKNLGINLFQELIFPIGNIFASIWSLIVELSYTVTAIIFFIKMYEKKCFKSCSESIFATTEIKDSEKSKVKKETVSETNGKLQKRVIKEKNNNQSISNTLTSISIYILKFFAIILTIGLILYLIGMASILGFAIYLIVDGVKYYGIFFLLLNLFFGGVLFLELCINFIFNRHIKALPFLIKLMVLIILTGISLTMSAVEIANTEIIYGRNSVPTKTITKEIDMTNNLILHNYDKTVIDNSLTNKIKIEYIYPDFNDDTELEIKLKNYDNDYYLNTNVNHVSWNKKFIKNFIDNLKDKKLYAYDFNLEKVIYISEENYEIIKNNAKTYHHSYTFEETYNVLNLVNGSNSNYLYLTLRSYQDEEVETVRIPKSFSSNITINNDYIFTFECSSRPDDIDDIFNKCKILNIKPVTE